MSLPSDWLVGTAASEFVSMAVVAEGSYGISDELIYSYPVTCKAGKWTIVQGINLPLSFLLNPHPNFLFAPQLHFNLSLSSPCIAFLSFSSLPFYHVHKFLSSLRSLLQASPSLIGLARRWRSLARSSLKSVPWPLRLLVLSNRGLLLGELSPRTPHFNSHYSTSTSTMPPP